jgi:hypothetical protein
MTYESSPKPPRTVSHDRTRCHKHGAPIAPATIHRRASKHMLDPAYPRPPKLLRGPHAERPLARRSFYVQPQN